MIIDMGLPPEAFTAEELNYLAEQCQAEQVCNQCGCDAYGCECVTWADEVRQEYLFAVGA